MAENFGKNFIPQKRVDPRQAGLKIYHTVDTLTAVAVIAFATVAFVMAGIFGSGFFITNQVEQLQRKVSELSGQFNEMEVKELVALDKKVATVSSVIDKHTSITDIREFLEDHTQSNVQVTQYSFSEGEGSQRLVVTGEALSYNTLANQAKILKNDMDISSVEFTDISPTETGTVSFVATMNLRGGTFLYNSSTQ